MGLGVAERLARAGHAVTVFERARQAGGLSTWTDYGPFVWDRFYHVILPSDTELLRWLRDLGLGDQVRWRSTRTGYFVDGCTYPLSNYFDFLRFPLLNIWQKIRLACMIVICSRLSDWRRLESMTVERFLVKTCGRRVFDKFWKPLLLAKLGESYRRVSAVFIWTYVKRLYSARDAVAQREQLGYVSGGYRRVIERVIERIETSGGRVCLGATVTRVRPGDSGGLEVTANGSAFQFDKVVFTSPVNVLRESVDSALVATTGQGADVEYLGVVCLVLVSRCPLTPYYVLNIADDKVPFTGVIGMSNVVQTSETAGLFLTYLPKYVLSTDPYLCVTDERIVTEFLGGLRRLLPEFSEESVVSMHVHRAVKVQPVQVTEYSRLVPHVRTLHPDFFVLNTAQFVNNTLNNNEVIRAVRVFFRENGKEFGLKQEETPGVV
jgi:protoporphyrinogen oxidase